FQFGRPVAANGLVAFRGTAQYTPPPQVDGGGIGRGLWGGNDPLHTVVVGQFGATGTPGGFTGEFGTIALDVAGDLAFTGAWVKTTPPASSGTGIWYSTAHVSLGDFTAVA